MFKVKDADYIAKNIERIEKQSIRKSKVFKNRLEEILKNIKERASQECTSLRITSVEGCKTDKQIRLALKERGFQVATTGNNTAIIYW